MIDIPVDLLNTVDQITALAKRHEALVKLADALRQIGSIDQAARETDSRLDALRQEQALEQGRLASLHAQREAQEQDIADRAEIAVQSARDIIADAQSKIAAKIAQATEKADKLISAATAEAENVRSRMAPAEAVHVENVRSLRAEAAALERANADARTALEDTNDKLAQAKEQARKLFG